MMFLLRWTFRFFILALAASAVFVWTQRGRVTSYVRSAESLLKPFLQQESVQRWSKHYGQDPLLITAIIKVESNFYHRAQSRKGALGLMQIMPATARGIARELRIRNFRPELMESPDLNIRFGTYYVSRLSKEFRGDPITVLASYNGGSKNVREWMKKSGQKPLQIESIEFPETRQYVEDVLRTWRWLKRLHKTRGVLLNLLSKIDTAHE